MITTAINLTCGLVPTDIQLQRIQRDARFNEGECVLDIVPEIHEEIGQVAGYHIIHGDCHPGRVDALVTPPTLHNMMFYGTDIPHILAALLQYEGDFNRKDKIIAKLRGHLPEGLQDGY